MRQDNEKQSAAKNFTAGATPHNSGAQIALSEILSEATKTGMKAGAFMRIFVNSDGIYASKLCAKPQA